jgi:hypothetical protein
VAVEGVGGELRAETGELRKERGERREEDSRHAKRLGCSAKRGTLDE